MAVYSVLGPGGYPRPPYLASLFATKAPAPVIKPVCSVLGPGGYPRPPYGSFAGKPASTGTGTLRNFPFIANMGTLMGR